MRKFLAFVFLWVTYSVAAINQADVDADQINHFVSKFFPPYTNTSTVDVVTGSYKEHEIEFIVNGAEPITLHRLYYTSSIYDPRYGGWLYNPEICAIGNFELPGIIQYASVGNRNGQIHCFEKMKNYSSGKMIQGTYYLDPTKQKISFSPEEIGHPLNTQVFFERENQNQFTYVGKIIDGKGGVRRFATPSHCWVHTKKIPAKHDPSNGQAISEIIIPPSAWTPYQLLVTEERLPNGNILCYAYQPWKEEVACPRFNLLKSITAYNSSKTKVLGSLELNYEQDKAGNVKGFIVSGSDGRTASFAHAGTPMMLSSTSNPNTPNISYHYQGTLLQRIEKPDGRFLAAEYDAQTKKIKSQSAPVGPSGEICPTYRYVYQFKHTEVYDAENNKTVYHYDDNKRITSIENYNHGTLYAIKRNQWDPTTGNLLCSTVEDPQGTIYLRQTYAYDENQNPILETIGDNKTGYATYRSYSKDGFNLKLAEWDDFGKKTTYTYRPNTNLLEKQFTYEKEVLRKREFWKYDDCAVCIRHVVDDGSKEIESDVTDVTYRLIKEIRPKQSFPCFGLAEVVEEKTIDSSKKKEVLLHKTHYTYTPFGKILKEEHFDCNGASQYIVSNEYNAKEQLVATVNPLGHRITYAYDQNLNLVEVCGPRADMHKKTTYDKANRPICVEEKQTDGSYLATHTYFDKCGRVAAYTDESGFKVSFVRDGLGRVTKVVHADGTFEENTYDILGNVIQEKDAGGNITRKVYDFRGNVVHIIHPDEAEEFFSYHPNGMLAFKIDRNGAKTVYTHDVFGHETSAIVYSSSGERLKSSSSTWTPFVQLSSTDGEGKTTCYLYDFAGRKIEEKMNERVLQYAYDSLGRLFKTIEGDAVTVHYFDCLGRMTEKRAENKKGDLLRREQYGYDEAGNPTLRITDKGIFETVYNTKGLPILSKDPLGHAVSFAYSYKGGLTKIVTNAKGIQTVTVHDMRGNPIDCLTKNAQGEVIQRVENFYDANGNLTQEIHHVFVGASSKNTISNKWEYGPNNRLERCLEAGIKETLYAYDGKGRLKSIIKPDKTILHHAYDDLGRLVRCISDDFDYNYVYDKNDRLVAVNDKISKTSTSLTYDAYGNIVQDFLANGLQLNFVKDPWGRRKSLILPDGSTANYTYNGNELYEVSRKGSIHRYQERDMEGLPTLVKLPGSLGMLSIQRDPLSRWKKVSSSIYSAEFSSTSYDATGNLLSYKFSDPLGSVEETYVYDELGQLKKEKTHAYLFDSFYNRLQKDESPYSVNALCQVTSDGENDYTYDANGNMTSNGVCSFTYDAQGRLASIIKGKQKIEFAYDAFHRRLSKSIFNNEKLQKVTYYLWDGHQEIGASEDKKKLLELRILGDSVDSSIDGNAVFYEISDKIYVPIHNHQGNVIALVDPSKKSRAETYRYTAFGEELTTVKFSPWRFAGIRSDSDIDLLFLNNRYYSPDLGRWITAYPQGHEGSHNPYAYLNNCPFRERSIR